MLAPMRFVLMPEPSGLWWRRLAHAWNMLLATIPAPAAKMKYPQAHCWLPAAICR
jgi:hypothetical protein